MLLKPKPLTSILIFRQRLQKQKSYRKFKLIYFSRFDFECDYNSVRTIDSQFESLPGVHTEQHIVGEVR